MTSRIGIILQDIQYLSSPIYILNKTGEDVFNNIYMKEKLNSYQENIYLLILDYNIFSDFLGLIGQKILIFSFNIKDKLRKIIFMFINLNLVFFIFIIITLFGYLSIYLLIIFKILNDVHIKLKEKLGDISLKEIFRKKLIICNYYLNFMKMI